MARKLCESCTTRTVGTGAGPGIEDDPATAKQLGVCLVCFTRMGWDNTHSDDGHGPEFTGTATDTDACWICHPELIPGTTTPRTGHTNTVAKSRTSHAACHHPRDPKFRAACRAAGGAGSAGSLKLFPAPKKK